MFSSVKGRVIKRARGARQNSKGASVTQCGETLVLFANLVVRQTPLCGILTNQMTGLSPDLPNR